MNLSVKALSEAEKKALELRSLTETKAYVNTIGAWLLDEKEKAIRLMSEATDPSEVHRAQGAYGIITSLLLRIDSTLSRASSVSARRHKNLTK